jgi:hypothetical protein
VKAGRVRVWAKHIGHTPLDIAANDSVTLRLELPLVSMETQRALAVRFLKGRP